MSSMLCRSCVVLRVKILLTLKYSATCSLQYFPPMSLFSLFHCFTVKRGFNRDFVVRTIRFRASVFTLRGFSSIQSYLKHYRMETPLAALWAPTEKMKRNMYLSPYAWPNE